MNPAAEAHGKTKAVIESLTLLQAISSLGPIVELDFQIDSARFVADLKPFESHWVRYNPRVDVPRFALSLTSLDGSLDGQAEHDFLSTYNELNATKLKEDHFSQPTPIFSAMTSLRPVLEKFQAHLGRSNIIRFGQGGYFPQHRDAIGLDVSSFRIFAPCFNCDRHEFVFILNGERVLLEQGKVYFFETRLDHTVYSFVDDCYIMILNVRVNDESFRNLLQSVRVR